MTLLSNATILYSVTAVVRLWWLNDKVQKCWANPSNLPLPPGPKDYPIVGSLLDFPTHKPWLAYDKWFKVYGVF